MNGLNEQNRSDNGCQRYARHHFGSRATDTRYGNRRNMVRRVSDMAEWKFIGARRYECSACGEGISEMPCDWANGEPLYNFCPYCGANMNMKKADGVEAEQTEPSDGERRE